MPRNDVKYSYLEDGGVELWPTERIPLSQDISYDDFTSQLGVDNDQEAIDKLAEGLREYSYAELETELTTTSLTYQPVVTLTTGTLRGGKYLITWSAEVYADQSDKPTEVLVQLDGTTTISEAVGNSLSQEWNPVSAVKEVSLSAGSHTVDMSYRQSSNKPVSIRRSRIALWRVSN